MTPVFAMLDGLLGLLRKLTSQETFDWQEGGLVRLSHWTAPIILVDAVAIGIFAAIKSDSLAALLVGIACAFSVAFSYFIGYKFIEVCRQAIANQQTILSNRLVLEVSGLSVSLIGFGALLVGVYLSIKTSSLEPVEYGVGVAVLCYWWSTIFFHPELIGIQISSEATIAEDAITMIALIPKLCLRAAPSLFGLTCLVGSVLLTKFAYGILTDATWLFELAGAGLTVIALAVMGAVFGLYFGLMAPYFAYVLSLTVGLLCGLFRSILSLNSNAKCDGESVMPNEPQDESDEVTIPPSDFVPRGQAETPKTQYAYFIANKEGGTHDGPHPAAELIRRYRLGNLFSDSYIWREGFDGWKRFDQCLDELNGS
jgi:hypothetical protein